MTLLTLATDPGIYDNICLDLTLLDLVRAISEITHDEKEIVATVQWMVSTGRVQLSGEFREEQLATAC